MRIRPIHLADHKSHQRAAVFGFSLIETVVTMAVAGVTITALHSGLMFGVRVVQSSRENLRATQILVEKMETLRLYTFNQITTPGFIPTTFTAAYDLLGTNSSSGLTYIGKITIANAPIAASYASDLKMVTVQVDWTSGNITHRRDVITLVSRNGLQTYIY